MNTTPWTDVARLPLPRREKIVQLDSYSQRRHVLAATPPEAALHKRNPLLSGFEVHAQATQLDQSTAIDWLFSDDPNLRRMALNAYTDQMAVYTDLITGSKTVHLSNTGLFPDVKHDKLPVAVMLDDATRQEVDLRWTTLYDMQDRRAEPWPGFFKIQNEYHGVSRQRYIPGDPANLGFIEQDETIHEHFLYGIGLQWNQLLMAGRWDRGRGMTAMQIRWANDQAKTAYETLIAAGFSTQAYIDDDATGGQSLQNDIATINAAIDKIRNDIFAKQAPKGGQTLEEIIPKSQPFYLLFNDLTTGYEERINSALNVVYNIVQGGTGLSVKEIKRPVIPLGSPYVTTGNFYLVLPKRKSVFSVFRGLTFFDFTDVRVAGVAEGEVGWGSDRALRQDGAQVCQLALI